MTLREAAEQALIEHVQEWGDAQSAEASNALADAIERVAKAFGERVARPLAEAICLNPYDSAGDYRHSALRDESEVSRLVVEAIAAAERGE